MSIRSTTVSSGTNPRTWLQIPAVSNRWPRQRATNTSVSGSKPSSRHRRPSKPRSRLRREFAASEVKLFSSSFEALVFGFRVPCSPSKGVLGAQILYHSSSRNCKMLRKFANYIAWQRPKNLGLFKRALQFPGLLRNMIFLPKY